MDLASVQGEALDQALQARLESQRAAFLAALPVSYAMRKDRLDRGLAMLLAHREALIDAAMSDFPNRDRDWTRIAEVFAPSQVFLGARKELKRWMQPERRKAPPPFRFFGARAEIQYQPLGVVGIMAAWNGPINLLLVPMATALAAGNRALLCPSDLMPACAEALDTAVAEYFDEAEVSVARGGLAVCKAFSRLAFDHLLFTGSPRVGAEVMAQAAANLVPVTLELGGKCPAIVLDDADIEDTAHRLIDTKTMNGGQACLAPDLLCVPRSRLDALVGAMDSAMSARYPRAATNAQFCGIVNARNYQRVTSLVDEAREAGTQVRVLGEGPERDDAQRRMAMHLLIDPPAHTRAMREEIFGPVMTVLSYDQIDTVCAQLAAQPKPLGLYVFSRDRVRTQHVLDRTFSGGVTINDTIFHYTVPELPFGGVGQSGMGAYSFGVEGFRRFSHARSVYRQAGPRSLAGVMQPPYGRLYDWVIRGQVERLAARMAEVRKR